MSATSSRFRTRGLFGLLVVLAALSAWSVVVSQPPEAKLPWAWAPSGILVGLALAFPATRATTTSVGAALTGLACFVGGVEAGLAVVLALTLLLECRVVGGVMRRDRDALGIRAEGDIARLIGASALAAASAALVVTGYLVVSGDRDPGELGLLALQVFLTHASALLGLLPFFLPSMRPTRTMSRTETALQAAILLSITTAVFAVPGLPPLYFALLPTFAWLAFRSSLRWGALMLAGVGGIATSFTLQGLGPVWEVVVRLDLPTALVPSLLSLFLLDCALVMFPIAVVVNQQRDAARVAHAERERLGRVVDATSSVGIVATDLVGTITLFSPGAAALLHRDVTEPLGSSLDVLGAVALESGAEPAAARDSPGAGSGCAVLETADSSTPRRLWRVLRADGEPRTVAITVMTTTDLDGRRDGYVATLEDLTDQQATHRAMSTALQHEQAAVARLSELDGVKSAFVATVSHELRTPVTSINGYVEMLADGDVGELTRDQQDLVRRVARNTRRLHLLIEDLLLVSRIESRSLSIERQRVDLGSLVREALLLGAPSVAGRDLEVSLPEADQQVVVQADPAQVQRLLGSVIDNACKFTPDGGSVRVTLDSDGECATILVVDSGVGIPPEEQSQLFTPFFRSSTAVRLATQGAGMGLTIARALAQAHGGGIEIISSPASGTTVSIRLPVHAPADRLGGVLPGTEQLPAPRGAGSAPA